MNVAVRTLTFQAALAILLFFHLPARAQQPAGTPSTALKAPAGGTARSLLGIEPGAVKTGIFIRMDAASFADVIGRTIPRAREVGKNNRYYLDLLGLLEAASRQKFSEIRLHVLEDTDFKEGRPHNFVLYLTGDFRKTKATGEFGALPSQLYTRTQENGLTVLKFHFLSRDNRDEACEALEYDGPPLVRQILNLLVTAIFDNEYRTLYSAILVDDVTLVFGTDALVARIALGKAGSGGPDRLAPPPEGAVGKSLFASHVGRIIGFIAREYFETEASPWLLGLDTVTLADDPAAGAFEARATFTDRSSAVEVTRFLDRPGNATVESIAALVGGTPLARFDGSREVALQLLTSVKRLKARAISSSEVGLTLRYAPAEAIPYRSRLNDTSALLAFSIVTFCNLINYRIVTSIGDCDSNMKTVDGACQLFQMENNRCPRDPDELLAKKYLHTLPVCPLKGILSIREVGGKIIVACSVHGGIKE